jgi:hypothetical protein
MARTEIRDAFQRHASTAEVSKALELLAQLGWARSESRPTGGRPENVGFRRSKTSVAFVAFVAMLLSIDIHSTDVLDLAV